MPMEPIEKRRDLFIFTRITVSWAATYPMRLNLLFPQWTIELFDYLVTIQFAILYVCRIFLNANNGDLELLVNRMIQIIIYIWTSIMKLYFRRIRPRLLEDIVDSINCEYRTRSVIGFTYVTMAGSLGMSNKWIKAYVYCCFIGTIFWLILPIAYGDRSYHWLVGIQWTLSKLLELQEFTDPELDECYCAKETKCTLSAIVEYTTMYSNAVNGQQDIRRNFRKVFKECMHCLGKMEKFYNPIWFFKTGEVIFLMCLVAFVSVKSTTDNSSFMKSVSLAQYLLLVAWEFLTICYYGEIIYINSQRCGDAVLRSPWCLHMREMINDFLTFLLNSNRPFKLTAGKMYQLNVDRSEVL